MGAAERWMWRGIGALVAGTALHFTLPREKVAPPLPRSEQPSISALRLTENSLVLPELKLWGAGPPTAFHFHVAVAAPTPEPTTLKPEPAPIRRATPASLKPPTEPTSPSTPESRPATVRAAVDSGANSVTKPVQRHQRKSANAANCPGQPVSFGADSSADSTLPRVTFSASCAGN